LRDYDTIAVLLIPSLGRKTAVNTSLTAYTLC